MSGVVLGPGETLRAEKVALAVLPGATIQGLPRGAYRLVGTVPHRVQTSVEMDADVNLVGRIGMLEMTATGDDEANPHGNQFDASGTLTIDLTPMVRRTRRRVPGGGHRSNWPRNAPVAAS